MAPICHVDKPAGHERLKVMAEAGAEQELAVVGAGRAGADRLRDLEAVAQAGVRRGRPDSLTSAVGIRVVHFDQLRVAAEPTGRDDHRMRGETLIPRADTHHPVPLREEGIDPVAQCDLYAWILLASRSQRLDN